MVKVCRENTTRSSRFQSHKYDFKDHSIFRDNFRSFFLVFFAVGFLPFVDCLHILSGKFLSKSKMSLDRSVCEFVKVQSDCFSVSTYIDVSTAPFFIQSSDAALLRVTL